MDALKELKKTAEAFAGGELAWASNATLALGVDWENEGVYIIDLEHPDGAVIDYSDLSINRVYETENN